MSRITKKGLFLLSFILIFSYTICGESNIEKEQYRLDAFEVYDSNDVLIQRVQIIYNDINKPVEVLATDSAGIPFNRKTMLYTKSGKILTQKNSRGNSMFVQTEYHYNESDYLLEVITKNEDDILLGTNTYKNDERGNPIEWISQYNNTNEKIHFLMEYDDEGRVTKSSEIDTKNELIYYSISEYDTLGNEISYTIYTPQGTIDQQLINEYAGSELVRTEIKDEKGNILYYTIYELNDEDKAVKISSYNQYDDLAEWIDIDYDDNGFESSRKSYNYEGKLLEHTAKENDDFGNILTLTIFDGNDEIISVTRNSYTNQPLNMGEEEFNALVFKL